MPFMFDVETSSVDVDAIAVAARAIDAHGAWPVHWSPGRDEKRWYGVVKHYPATLEIETEDEQGHILRDPDTWDEERWILRDDETATRLAQTLVLLTGALGALTFRATWAGSPVREDIHTNPDGLADLIRAHQLNDHTRYHVEPVSG